MKKFTKRFLSLVLVAAMLSTLCTVFAYTTGEAGSGTDTAQIRLLGTTVMPWGVVKTYSVDLPPNDLYASAPAFHEYATDGTTAAVTGTWEPFYSSITFEFENKTSGGAVGTSVSASGETARVTLYRDATWGLNVRSSGGERVTGVIQVTLRNV